MDKPHQHNGGHASLYPAIQPFDQRMVDVGDGHVVYVEQCGRPDGLPVVILHGGPGGGCSPAMRRYFDPNIFRVILFDQRGCGRSRPHASTDDNTTWHLIRDIEHIRELLHIDQWMVFGGSWGAALGLLYAQKHPDRALHLILRGVFLMEQSELDWFYGGGAGKFWPEKWAEFARLIPDEERGDFIQAYARRLFCGDAHVENEHARAWVAWENGLASIDSNGLGGAGPVQYARAFARLENHYFVNKGFLEQDGQIIRDAHKLEQVGVSIVQGRFDMICPPISAARLHAALPASTLKFVPKAGHALSEPGISSELVRIMDKLGQQALRS